MKKGIILAGGHGSRLGPLTRVLSKQLLPVYDKPLIFYPLSTLIELGIRDILIITKSEFLKQFSELIGDGSNYGVKIAYKIQNEPNGIAEAFLIGEKFINNNPITLVLGDNIFYGINFSNFKKIAQKKNFGSIICSYSVDNPERYGVIKITNKKIIKIEEKPKKFLSNLAITGLYLFDNNVVNFAKSIQPSKRGELEIVDLIKKYKNINKLHYVNLGPGSAWLDAGSPDSLLQASQLIQTIQKRQKYPIGSPELTSLKEKIIKKKFLLKQINSLPTSSYKNLLLNTLK